MIDPIADALAPQFPFVVWVWTGRRWMQWERFHTIAAADLCKVSLVDSGKYRPYEIDRTYCDGLAFPPNGGCAPMVPGVAPVARARKVY